MLGKRRSQRLPIPFVRVEIELAEEPIQVGWAGSAIDINCDGMALMLPSDLGPGRPLMLSFSTHDDTSFKRVPARVVRYDAATGSGAVEFSDWNTDDTLALLNFLVYSPTLN